MLLSSSLPTGSDGSAAASSLRVSPQGAAKDGDGDIKPDLVRQYLSSEQFSKEENNRLKLLQVRTEFSRHSADCGSTEAGPRIRSLIGTHCAPVY